MAEIALLPTITTNFKWSVGATLLESPFFLDELATYLSNSFKL